jgi:type VI secretion system protein VasJ
MTYIEVDAEMNKLGRIEAGEPDWYQIEQGCKTILSSVAKDVEVASWYGHALFKQYGYPGLAAALGLLTELVKNFWDGMYPSRPRRRKARIETLADQFTEGEWFRDNQPSGDADFDALDLCVTRSEELDAALTEKMPDDPPDFKKFMRGLKSHAEKRPKPQEPAPAAAAAPGAEAAKAPAAPTAGGFPAGDIQDVSGAVNALLNACTFLRSADPTDPIPYAVIRVVKWSKISMPATEEAKFQIPPPEKTTVEALAHQMANNLWEHLLKGAEAAFRSNDPLWLDLQRYTCAALAGYGPSYEKAKQAVMAATAGLVNRLGDGLFELKFSSGMPLCGGETRMWIETEVLAAQGGDERGGGGTVDGRLAEAMASAKKLAGSGKLKEGLKELQEGLTQCMQRRDRFLWRLSIARLCFDAQRHQLAAPLLEECYDDVQRFNIDDWEPSLAASVADTLYRCRKSLASAQKEPPPEDLKSVRESFAWLCRLDPLAALAADPSGK